MLLASVMLAVVALIALGLVVAQPWWQYAPAILPVLTVVQFIACVLATLLFVIGMAGYGSVQHALEQAAAELQQMI